MNKHIFKKVLLTVAFSLISLSYTQLLNAAEEDSVKTTSAIAATSVSNIPPLVHGNVGDVSEGVPGKLTIRNIGKRQQYEWKKSADFDSDIFSPKSVTFSSDGRKIYVNSLEGCKTVVYAVPSLEKEAVINYDFPTGIDMLWAKPSGFYPFTHYKSGESRAFRGKPVESCLSHNGRYLWVTFYRRSFDINAQDPSAVAVVDTRTNRIVRMFETGPLPKMIAVSPDSKMVAVTHWGDNTVGLMDISSDKMENWHHLSPIVIGMKKKLNYPLDSMVNRDKDSGNLLRGTVFSSDGKWLFVSGMAGPLNIIDVNERKLVGTVGNAFGVRHLEIFNGMLYGSCNRAGQIIRLPIDSLKNGILSGQGIGKALNGKIERCKTGGGARTLSLTPDGKYIFVACNSASAIYAIDTETMTVADQIRVDSYPVGLAISPDGKYMAATSQGREHTGGNAMNLFEIIRPDLPDEIPMVSESDSVDTVSNNDISNSDGKTGNKGFRYAMEIKIGIAGVGVIILLIIIVRLLRIRQGRT